MKFDVITLFPEMFSAIKDEGIIARALKKSIIEINTWQLRDFTANKYKNVDDKPYGGGSGMVMQVEPIRNCIKEIKKKNSDTKVIYLSPQGQKLDQKFVEELANFESLTLLCGRYEGVDERILLTRNIEELSIGDFILSGGETASFVVIDSILRLLPGVLGNNNSAKDETFENDLLEYPQFTKPKNWEGKTPPEVLLSGDHAKIKGWRLSQSEAITRLSLIHI